MIVGIFPHRFSPILARFVHTGTAGVDKCFYRNGVLNINARQELGGVLEEFESAVQRNVNKRIKGGRLDA